MPSLKVGLLTLRAARKSESPTTVNLARVFDSKKVGQLAIVVAIMDHEIGAFASLQRSNLVAASERIRGVDRRSGQRLGRCYLHLGASQGKDHRHRRRR